MHIFGTSQRTLLALCAALTVGIIGCSRPLSEEEPKPVSWASGFRMVELLAEDMPLNSQDDLNNLLDADWYSSINVVDTRSAEEATFTNCNDYSAERTSETRTLRENEMNAFLELIVMCRTTEVLAKAGNSDASYIPKNVIDASSPEHYPAAVALEISETESEKNASDSSVGYWSDVNGSFQVNALTPEKVKFHHDAGIQQLELVGRGDFNGDGVEDVLISSRDSVEGGSYFNLRLFSLSVDAEGAWYMIEEYDL